MAEQFMPAVKPASERAQKPFHPSDQVALGRLDHQVEVIRHEAVRMDLPCRLETGLRQRLHEASPVPVVPARSAPVGRHGS